MQFLLTFMKFLRFFTFSFNIFTKDFPVNFLDTALFSFRLLHNFNVKMASAVCSLNSSLSFNRHTTNFQNQTEKELLKMLFTKHEKDNITSLASDRKAFESQRDGVRECFSQLMETRRKILASRNVNILTCKSVGAMFYSNMRMTAW